MEIADRIANLKSRVRDGVSPAMATPLVPGTHTVNLAVVPQLVNFLADKGVKGLFISSGAGIPRNPSSIRFSGGSNRPNCSSVGSGTSRQCCTRPRDTGHPRGRRPASKSA